MIGWGFSGPAEDQSSFSNIHVYGSQQSVTSALGDPIAYPGLCRDLHSCAHTFPIPALQHIHIVKNKIKLRKGSSFFSSVRDLRTCLQSPCIHELGGLNLRTPTVFYFHNYLLIYSKQFHGWNGCCTLAWFLGCTILLWPLCHFADHHHMRMIFLFVCFFILPFLSVSPGGNFLSKTF